MLEGLAEHSVGTQLLTRPCSSPSVKVLLSRQTCLLLVAAHGETFVEKKNTRESVNAPGYGMLPRVAHSLPQLLKPGVIFK